MRDAMIVSVAALALGCGAAAPSPTAGSAPETSGGEIGDAMTERPLRTTTPRSVPAPAVPRGALSEPLRRFWTELEQALSIRPPEGPREATEEAITAWARGPLAAWIAARRHAMQAAIATSEAVRDDPAHERGVAAALLGHALEELVAGMRAAPLPRAIAEDAALLEAYASRLRDALQPIAREASIAYAFCERRFADLGEQSAWRPWRTYCGARGGELVETLELAPPAE